jgi:hypothetical protein
MLFTENAANSSLRMELWLDALPEQAKGGVRLPAA